MQGDPLNTILVDNCLLHLDSCTCSGRALRSTVSIFRSAALAPVVLHSSFALRNRPAAADTWQRSQTLLSATGSNVESTKSCVLCNATETLWFFISNSNPHRPIIVRLDEKRKMYLINRDFAFVRQVFVRNSFGPLCFVDRHTESRELKRFGACPTWWLVWPHPLVTGSLFLFHLLTHLPLSLSAAGSPPLETRTFSRDHLAHANPTDLSAFAWLPLCGVHCWLRCLWLSTKFRQFQLETNLESNSKLDLVFVFFSLWRLSQKF